MDVSSFFERLPELLQLTILLSSYATILAHDSSLSNFSTMSWMKSRFFLDSRFLGYLLEQEKVFLKF